MAKILFDPKSISEHQQRYAAAVETIVDTESVEIGVAARPGELPRNIFDCHDGMRLIISRDRTVKRVLLHVSMSFEPDSELWHKAKDGTLDFDKALRLAEARFAKISGIERPLCFVGLSHGKRVPHWCLEEEKSDGREIQTEGSGPAT